MNVKTPRNLDCKWLKWLTFFLIFEKEPEEAGCSMHAGSETRTINNGTPTTIGLHTNGFPKAENRAFSLGLFLVERSSVKKKQPHHSDHLIAGNF